MVGRWPDLSPEDAVADHGVEQHQWEDEETLAPEHEGETGMRGCSFFDGDRERDHVRPKRDRQRAKRGHENERDHVEWHPSRRRRTLAAATSAAMTPITGKTSR